jgi:syntaxin 5
MLPSAVAPATGGGSISSSNNTTYYCACVSRSEEFLSCAKTAVKLAQRQQDSSENDGWWTYYQVGSMQLHTISAAPVSFHVLEDGVTLLRTMQLELQQLERLVRRRGHTNDPSDEIAATMQRLETDTRELVALIPTMLPLQARGQQLRHWEMLQEWFRAVVQKQSEQLKSILKVRGQVLEEQQQRRKRFQTHQSTATAVYEDNPLFQISTNSHLSKATPPLRSSSSQSAAPPPTATLPVNGSYPARSIPMQRGSATAPASHYYASSSPAAYGGGGGGGYYGGGGATTTTSSYGGGSVGMRQRRVQQPYYANSLSDTSQQPQQSTNNQVLLQEQQHKSVFRQQRVQHARQAERSLAELGTLFGKMTSLIVQQSEVLEKIEDDVEAAVIDVTAGQEEITILYALKKGNRALIIKVFALLIFMIVFMRFYVK